MDLALRIVLSLPALAMLYGAAMLLFATPTGMELYTVRAEGPAELSTIRSEIGGVQLALAILFLAGLWRQRELLWGAVVIVASMLPGRIVTLVVDGPAPEVYSGLVTEMIVLALLGTYLHRTRPA